jgi:5-hydroxyisourate hydrolase
MAPTISTHVLDTGRGEPGRGVPVSLYRADELLSRQTTDEDGRIADLVRGPLAVGRYRLVFEPPSPFFSRVELELRIDDVSRHYHVPLLVSPYSCASYRGS